MAKFNLNALAGALNEGGSIFGELNDQVAKIDVLKSHVQQDGQPVETFIIGRFEVRTKTKSHNSPYVTVELASPSTPDVYHLFSGYGTALGTKLLKIAELCIMQDKENAKIEGNHAYVKVPVELPVFFKLNKSQAGEYLDMYAVEEETI